MNLADSNATAAALRSQLANHPIAGLKSLIILDKGAIDKSVSEEGYMAVDLFCYAVETPQAVETKLARLAAHHPDLFSNRFLISKVLVPNSAHKDIARGYGLSTESLFIVSLNDKNSADLLTAASGIIKDFFGKNEVIILNGNEKLI